MNNVKDGKAVEEAQEKCKSPMGKQQEIKFRTVAVGNGSTQTSEERSKSTTKEPTDSSKMSEKGLAAKVVEKVTCEIAVQTFTSVQVKQEVIDLTYEEEGTPDNAISLKEDDMNNNKNKEEKKKGKTDSVEAMTSSKEIGGSSNEDRRESLKIKSPPPVSRTSLNCDATPSPINLSRTVDKGKPAEDGNNVGPYSESPCAVLHLGDQNNAQHEANPQPRSSSIIRHSEESKIYSSLSPIDVPVNIAAADLGVVRGQKRLYKFASDIHPSKIPRLTSSPNSSDRSLPNPDRRSSPDLKTIIVNKVDSLQKEIKEMKSMISKQTMKSVETQPPTVEEENAGKIFDGANNKRKAADDIKPSEPKIPKKDEENIAKNRDEEKSQKSDDESSISPIPKNNAAATSNLEIPVASVVTGKHEKSSEGREVEKKNKEQKQFKNKNAKQLLQKPESDEISNVQQAAKPEVQSTEVEPKQYELRNSNIDNSHAGRGLPDEDAFDENAVLFGSNED